MSYTAHGSQLPVPFGTRSPNPPPRTGAVSLVFAAPCLYLVTELSFSVTNVVYDITVRVLHLVVSCARYIY